MVKLSPNARGYRRRRARLRGAGADAISLVNTFLGMAVDVKRKKAVFNNVYAGLSGPAIQPVALRMVHQAAHAVKIPVVGLGGIATAEDALKFLMAGARAVQVGTMTFANPNAMPEIIDGLSAYCEEEGLSNLQEICGIL
jgi:dihydroorotate dehydrogenase (NAD+) catalytic subunit